MQLEFLEVPRPYWTVLRRVVHWRAREKEFLGTGGFHVLWLVQ